MNNQLSLSGTRLRAGDLLPRAIGNADVAGVDDNSAMAVRLLHEALRVARGVAGCCERQYYAALRIPSPALAAAALEHAHEVRLQADSLNARIAGLGGTPATSPGAAPPSFPSETGDASPLVSVLGNFLMAGHVAIESYRQIVTLMESCDRATQVVLERIVSGEEARASHLAALLEQASAPAAQFAPYLPRSGAAR